jgi:hypothetical protein
LCDCKSECGINPLDVIRREVISSVDNPTRHNININITKYCENCFADGNVMHSHTSKSLKNILQHN